MASLMATRFRRRELNKKKRKYQALLLVGGYVAIVGFVLISRGGVDYPEGISDISDTNLSPDHRLYKRDVNNNTANRLLIKETPGEENCTPRAIYEFPDNFFTLEETKNGGVVIHILIVLYMFSSLALVCDDYFVASLEMICDNLGLQEDVAGATFMAAGSSAPELFTSIIGVFIAQSDVGVGTIVGSAVFNILFIIAICALFSGMVVYLTWWPMTRDCIFYLISILCLILVMDDSRIHWYEALVMVLLYILYIVIMYFNRRLEVFFIEKSMKIPCGFLKCQYDVKLETNPLLNKTQNGAPNGNANKEQQIISSTEIETEFGGIPMAKQNEKTLAHEEYDSPWDIPEGFLSRVFWVGMVPVKALLFVTIPDCRWPGRWRKTYPATFTLSIVWIAGFSYLMVWMVTISGDALGIPDTVMGLTFLAAGTSVPDALSSLFVSRDGLGDMAVSNSIGSNVFDILMCLGFPWLLKTVAVDTGGVVEISSKGLLFSAITLLTTVAFVLIATHINRWKLTKRSGVMFLIVYAIVITLACLYELNVFSDLNLPTCPRR